MIQKILILAISCIAASSVFAAEKEGSKMDPKMAEMMKSFHEAATPGAEHDLLKGLVGKWKVSTKSWQSEDAKPEETTGTSVFKALLGGRFFQQDYKGKMMGQPYEGIGMMGYNNLTKKFESSWYDTMSTAAMTFEGSFDAKTKTLSESGEFQCPVRKSTQKMRSEMKMLDKDNMTFALFMPDMVTGKEYKGMEQVYKRSK